MDIDYDKKDIKESPKVNVVVIPAPGVVPTPTDSLALKYILSLTDDSK